MQSHQKNSEENVDDLSTVDVKVLKGTNFLHDADD
jgi:hypothetical protein